MKWLWMRSPRALKHIGYNEGNTVKNRRTLTRNTYHCWNNNHEFWVLNGSLMKFPEIVSRRYLQIFKGGPNQAKNPFSGRRNPDPWSCLSVMITGVVVTCTGYIVKYSITSWKSRFSLGSMPLSVPPCPLKAWMKPMKQREKGVATALILFVSLLWLVFRVFGKLR